jgi:two-component system sensor histidine kinase KdpD
MPVLREQSSVTASPVSDPASERRGKPGRLKVFLGMAPGAGKTAAMLQAALAEKTAGRNVLIATAQIHDDDALATLASRLPRVASHPGGEIHAEEIIALRPDIAVVDELARANPRDARHPKRFQDVVELLEAGIDVFTTLNVYEIASRADLLWPLAGVQSGQIVPDGLLDKAEIVLVDAAPAELIARTRKVQPAVEEQPAPHAAPVFEEDSLVMLREMAARYFAERLARDSQERRHALRATGPARAGHRILVAVESDEASEKLILWTRRLAGSLNASWIVLYVETSPSVPPALEARVTRNLELARELGAEVITTADSDLAAAVLRVANSRNITQIVIGKKNRPPWWRKFQADPVLARLTSGSGDIGVHVVPLHRDDAVPVPRRRMAGAGWAQYAIVVATVLAVAFAGYLVTPRVTQVGAHAMAFLSLLAVVILALFVERGPALLAAALSAGIWDYFFLPPVFAFRVSHFEDALLLIMYFVVALALGQLTTRIRAQEIAERQRESRATALYLLGRELAEAATVEQIIGKVVSELGRTFDAEVAVLLPDARDQLEVRGEGTLKPDDRERAVAAWAFEHRQAAGKFTPNLPAVDSIYVPLESSSSVLGVAGLRLGQPSALTIHQRNLLDALTRQIALALDRQRLRELSENAKLLAESERLGKTLLDSISHELRTPLAAIKAAAGNLAEFNTPGAPFSGAIEEIQEAAQRLNRLVGKILDIARLESGHVQPLSSECEINDIVNLAVAETETELARHKLEVQMPAQLPIVRTDFVLLQQALMNLLSNAAVHTPAGTPVTLRVWTQDCTLYFSVADRGPGIDPQLLPRIFDKFFRGPGAPTGGSGLELSLVKGFVEALNGTITAKNREGGGIEFTIALPITNSDGHASVSI